MWFQNRVPLGPDTFQLYCCTRYLYIPGVYLRIQSGAAALCVAILLLLRLAAAARCCCCNRVLDGKNGCCGSLNLPVFSFSSFKHGLFFMYPLAVLSHCLRPLAYQVLYYILGNWGHARSQGGRQSARGEAPHAYTRYMTMYSSVCHVFVCFRTYIFVRALFGKNPRTSTPEGRPDTVVEVWARSVNSGARGRRSNFFSSGMDKTICRGFCMGP